MFGNLNNRHKEGEKSLIKGKSLENMAHKENKYRVRSFV